MGDEKKSLGDRALEFTIGLDEEGESNVFNSAGEVAKYTFSAVPYKPVSVGGELFVDVTFGLGHEVSDGKITVRDVAQLTGSIVFGFAGSAITAPTAVGSIPGGFIASVGCVLARTTLNTPHPAQNGA